MSNESLVEEALADLIRVAPTLQGASASMGLDALAVAVGVARPLLAALEADLQARSVTPNAVKDNVDAATQAAIDARFPKG